MNQARKFAEKIGGVIDVIKNALDAFSGFTTFKNVLPETLDAFAATLKLAVNKMGEIAEEVDKSMVKTAARFADRANAVVGLIKNALDAFAPLATFAAIPGEAMDALFAGISLAVSKMEQLAGTLDTELLSRAVSIANQSQAIFGAIKAGVDSLTSLVDFKAVAPEAFQALLDGFNQAVAILNQMLVAATQFESIAIAIKDKLVSAAQYLKDGAAAMAAGLAAATTALSSGSAASGALAAGGGSSAPSAPLGALAAGAAASASSSRSSQTTTIVHVNVGGVIHQSQLQDVIIEALQQADRRGRVQFSFA